MYNKFRQQELKFCITLSCSYILVAVFSHNLDINVLQTVAKVGILKNLHSGNSVACSAFGPHEPLHMQMEQPFLFCR